MEKKARKKALSDLDYYNRADENELPLNKNFIAFDNQIFKKSEILAISYERIPSSSGNHAGWLIFQLTWGEKKVYFENWKIAETIYQDYINDNNIFWYRIDEDIPKASKVMNIKNIINK